jgi:hypothetical protein
MEMTTATNPDPLKNIEQFLVQIAELRIKLDDIMASGVLNEQRIVLRDYIATRLDQMTQVVKKDREQHFS